MSRRKLLVIGAHSADFVWRAAGTIALLTSQGASATVLALSNGERGESGELWKAPNQTVENVLGIRYAPGQERIYVAGEKEHERQELVRQRGIPVNRNLRRDLQTVRDALGLAGYEAYF